MEYKEYLAEKLAEVEVTDLVDIWNVYCEVNSYTDDFIYMMYDFDELMCGNTPTQIADMIIGTDFTTYDDFWYYDGWGNLSSGTNLDELEIDLDELAECIVENPSEFQFECLDSIKFSYELLYED